MKNLLHAFKCNPLFVLILLLLLIRLESAEVYAQKKSLGGYGEASYDGSQNGKYMSAWLLAGPFFVKEGHTGELDMQTQEAAFEKDIIQKVDVVAGKPVPAIAYEGKTIPWKAHHSKSDLIDLNSVFNDIDYVYGYALAEIRADSSYTAFLGIGSDDAVKVWHNGKAVHSNRIARSVEPDDDVVPLHLVKGSNQLLIKVQDVQGGWGFMARLLDKASLSQHLVEAAGRGDLDAVDQMLKAGAAINTTDQAGLTALQRAQLSGRADIVTLLIEKGAAKKPLPSAEQLLDEMYSALNKEPQPGAAVLVGREGKIVYQKGFGFADVEGKVPVTPETKFRIGSITKQFTASAILRLQEEGLLNVHDKLSKYLPDFPRAEEVTIHQLLTHTSGIHSYTSKANFMEMVTKQVTPEEVIVFFKDDPYDFDPGEKYLYNNSAYFLLGYLVEKISGKPYAQYLKEQFFDPLHMSNTGVHRTDLNLAHEAKGYGREGSKYTSTVDWNMSWAGGAGALYSTVGDLFLWNEALFGGKVLKESSTKAAFTEVKLNNGKAPGVRYGYGLQLDNYRGQPVIHHGGGLHGFISQLARFPDEQLTVVILNNSSPAVIAPDANKIAEFFLWDKMEKQLSYSAGTVQTAEEVGIYAGRYDFTNGMVLTITAKDKNLFARLSGQPEFQIFPSGEDAYFWKVVEARIKFFKNEKGEVTHALFYQNGNEINAKKLEEKKVAAIDPTVYKQYVGKYSFVNNATLTITADEKNLFAQVTGQPPYPIFPSGEDAFFWKVVEASIKFVRDEKGQVQYGLFEQAGSKIKAEKLNK